MVLNNTCEWMPSLRQSAYGLVHVRLCNGVEASLPWKLLWTYLESCASIVQAVVCAHTLPARWNQLHDAVGSRNPSKSTLTHDAVTAAVLHRYYQIILVGAGLIQFVYNLTRTWPRNLPVTGMHFRHFLRELPGVLLYWGNDAFIFWRTCREWERERGMSEEYDVVTHEKMEGHCASRVCLQNIQVVQFSMIYWEVARTVITYYCKQNSLQAKRFGPSSLIDVAFIAS